MPFAELANAVTATTTLVAASHVSWITGEVAPAELAEVHVPVILDGAQGAGAVPVDVQALGCVAYAAAGQKWLCGADGTGMLYLRPGVRRAGADDRPDVLLVRGRLARPGSAAARRARSRFDAAAAARGGRALRRRALEVLEAEGLDAIHRAARPTSRDRFAARLAEAGYTVAPRGRSTLVSFEVPGSGGQARAAARAAASRSATCPGTPYLRASVGAWNDESDLERLLDALL